MTMDLQTLRTDIQSYLEQSNLAIFHGFPNLQEQVSVYWDTERHPDFREFLHAAEKAGATLVVFYYEQFTQDEIDDAFDDLETALLGREERRQYESRMRELQKYEGFTCELELSFSLTGRVYMYKIRTDWYREWEDITSELDLAADENTEEEDSEDDPMSGYFSTN
ncbi:MAG: hypothetical protein JO061_09100 [Acidobacteriaceae bacterium]|nr:hypothetical protein [Acidobacteriaceae bacterium]